MSAINKADTDLGGNTLCYYGENYGNGNDDSNHNECIVLGEQIIKNLSIQKDCNGNALADGCIPPNYTYLDTPGQPIFAKSYVDTVSRVLVLSDGTIIIMYGHNNPEAPLFIVDINGAKGPNEFGKDMFEFLLRKKDGGGFYIDESYFFRLGTTNKSYFRKLSDIYKE